MHNSYKLPFLAIAGVVALSKSTMAANILVQFDPLQTSVTQDAHYNDGESAVFDAVADDPRVKVKLAGRDYLQDPLDGEEWGLLDNSLWWNEGKKGWLVRQGWESSVIGETVNHQPDGDVKAAYLQLTMSKPEEVVFGTITVSFENPVNTEFVNLWGSTSADGFGTFSLGVVEHLLGNEKATVTFSNLNYIGTDPLEIRIYGVLGEDDGTFGVRLTVIPEPTVPLLGISALVLMFPRRRHRDLL